MSIRIYPKQVLTAKPTREMAFTKYLWEGMLLYKEENLRDYLTHVKRKLKKDYK